MLVFIAIMIVWALVVKRDMAEATLVGMLIVAAFGGSNALTILKDGLKYALNYEVLFASLAFVLMSFLLQNTSVLSGMLRIFNRLFKRLKGGPAYVNTAISSFLGMLSGGNTANAATSGAFTAQWLLDSGWTREQAATLIAGNGGLGAGFPPSSSMFIVLGFPTVMYAVTQGQLYIALMITGFYQVAWRVLYVHWVIKKNGIGYPQNVSNEPWKVILRESGKNLLLFLGPIIPVAFTMGPLSEAIAARSELWADAIDSINMLVWIPTIMIVVVLCLGWKDIKAKYQTAESLADDLIPQFKSTGGLLFFVFAASRMISKLGLSADMEVILQQLNLPPVVAVFVILILIAVVAGPLSSTATLTSVGLISHSILVAAGMDPLCAAAAILMVASTEGASPPASGALFVACGLTECDPPKIYIPLIVWFVVPIVALASLVCFGILPIPN